jgi:hypothetical protein
MILLLPISFIIQRPGITYSRLPVLPDEGFVTAGYEVIAPERWEGGIWKTAGTWEVCSLVF